MSPVSVDFVTDPIEVPVPSERTRSPGYDLMRNRAETQNGTLEGVRPLVSDSWTRSLSFGLSRDAAPMTTVVDDDLRTYRDAHPLARVLPVIQQLLVRHTVGSGLIVAIGDHAGRLLWVDGDRDMRRLAETMAFIEGADWSEHSVGTAAPGTALTLGRSVQITQDEHFSRLVHPWSCSAVPVRNRATGKLLGVIDITGGNDAVAPVTLPLLEATVAAVEAELSLLLPETPSLVSGRQNDSERGAPPGSVSDPSRTHAPRNPAARRHTPRMQGIRERELSVLGRDEATLSYRDTDLTLSLRHAELLTLLAWHPSGMNAAELAHAVYGRDGAVVTLRAEMVRLRKALAATAPELVPQSRPYRLPQRLHLDARQVLDFLDRGAHRVALGSYSGPVLPGSTAPGIEQIRRTVSARLRESLLSGANVDILLAYAQLPEAQYDVVLWRVCLRLLPPRSPRRAAVVEHLEQIDSYLS